MSHNDRDTPEELLPPTLATAYQQLATAYQRIAALEREAGSSQTAASMHQARAAELAEKLSAAEARLALLSSELVEAQHKAEQRAEALEWVQAQLDRERRRWWTWRPW